MKVLKTLNDYLLVEELPSEEKESEIYVGEVLPTQKRARIVMLPEDFSNEYELKVNEEILFYAGTGIPAGDYQLVHIQNIMGKYAIS
jgi:hypothetical protein